jgi:hypothetical protein
VQVPSSHPGNVSDPSSEFAGRRGSERCTSGTADWFEFFSGNSGRVAKCQEPSARIEPAAS